MNYPFLIGGEQAGSLTVSSDGLFSVYEVTAPGRSGLLRVSVYGGGTEGYLGVMQPWSGGLYLRRRMSRIERAAMPQHIEYAAQSGLSGTQPAAAEPQRNETSSAARSSAMEPQPISGAAAGSTAENTDSSLLWFSRADGTLTAFDGESSIIAIPARLRRDAPGAVLRRIGGQWYMLFRY